MITRGGVLGLLEGKLREDEAIMALDMLCALGILEVVESMRDYLKPETIADFILLSEEQLRD